MNQPAGPYVFVSYSSTDYVRAFALADRLEAAGIGVWIDRQAIVGGTSWSAEIVKGISDCAVFVVLCSQTAMASENVQRELQLAMEEHRPLLPLLLERVQQPPEIRYILAGRQWVELLDRPEDHWLPDVMRALERLGGSRQWAVGSKERSGDDRPHAAATETGHSPTAYSLLPTASRTNLPTPLTSFIGREQELTVVTTLLRTARLLTLTGPGGTGKTRLAIAAARQVVGSYSDGTWFVDLSGVSDPAGVVPAIAQMLGVVESGGRSLAVSLAAYLRHKCLLLVVDNFEQVVGAALTLHDFLVEAAGLALLVTSRSVLRIQGEREYPVPPLPLPEPAAGDELERSPAVQLFVERARALRPDFAVTAESAAAIVEICRRLDGLPLAIELAAARIKLLPPPALLARLERRLPLLSGGERDRPRRQQTLRGAIQWSWELLEPAEQALFRRLGVFAGGWTLEAAEVVCTDQSPTVDSLLPTASLDVLTGLESLVDKSLVQQREMHGEPRFTMLATLREFALEQLESSGEEESLNRRHAERFCDLAERALADMLASGHILADYLRPLEVERENLLAALQWALGHAETELGLRLVGALYHWFYLRAPGEGLRWSEALLALPAAAAPALARAMAPFNAGVCAFTVGRNETGHAYMDEAVALFRVCEDLPFLSYAMACSGLFLPPTEAERALKLSGDALSIARGTGIPFFIVFAEWAAGTCRFTRAGDLAAARAHLEEALRLSRALDGDWLTMLILQGLAQVAQQQGQREEAMRLNAEARPLAEALGDRLVAARVSINLALLAAEGDDPDRVATEWRRGLDAARDLGIAPLCAVCLAGVAGLLAGRGEAAAAATLLGASAGVWQDAQSEFHGHSYRQAHEPALAATRAAQSPEAFAREWAEGEALSLEQATTMALAALAAAAPYTQR